MWIHYMEEIGIWAFVFLIVAHVAVYMIFKIKRRRLLRLKKSKKTKTFKVQNKVSAPL